MCVSTICGICDKHSPLMQFSQILTIPRTFDLIKKKQKLCQQLFNINVIMYLQKKSNIVESISFFLCGI